MLGQIDTVEEAINRLDEIAPRSDSWPVDFAKLVLTYATAIVSTAGDFAYALIQDLGTQSAGSLARARSAQQTLSDTLAGLVPLIRAAQGATGVVTAKGLRSTVLAALRVAVREWQNVEIADKSRSRLDIVSGEYRGARERLTKKFWELGQGLAKVPAPVAVPTVPPAAAPLGTSKGAALFGIVLVGLGAAGLAVWLGRRVSWRSR